jgi:hypothetical protein
MNKNIRYVSIVALLLCVVIFTQCYDDQYEPTPVIINPVDTISYKTDISPLFVSGCAQSICHGVGASAPDLTSANSYNSLVNGGFLNTDDPVKSELYLWLIGDGGRAIMPPSGRNEKLIELTLGWMSQGALNN